LAKDLLCGDLIYYLPLRLVMHATVAKPSNLGGVVRSNPDGKPPQLLKSQRLEAGEELVKLYSNLYIEGTRCEFDSSAVKDYTPDETSETVRSRTVYYLVE
jgi:hypothetical protein